MSVEPSESMREVWTRWQGHVINGVYPLGRYLGCSDHSGVFLTRCAAQGPADVAIKLVPTDRTLAQSLLPRWKRARSLAHPHLLPLLEWGGCQLDGLPYLYAVMEYADQTLAQLLPHRALTEDETREMLLPALDALAFLHGRNLLQGQLKPANILVVGDQLKLASDTVRRVSDGTISTDAPTLYDPPEAGHGSNSTAADIWALGVSLFEALTRRSPSGSGEHVSLPADFPPAFRDVVAGCLSPSPQDRPTVTELLAWARGPSPQSAPAATRQPEVLIAPRPRTPDPLPPTVPPAPTPQAAPAATRQPEVLVPSRPRTLDPPPPPTVPLAPAPQDALTGPTGPSAPTVARASKPRALSVILAAVLILGLGSLALHEFRIHHSPAAPAVPIAAGAPSPTPGTAAPAAPPMPESGRGDATAPSVLHEEIPEVPWSARRTLRGHIKVWVRVMVEQDGSVIAAVADRAGPSRYFQRLAIESARKWTFPPVDSPTRRLMQVRFEFSREGTTGRVVTLR